MRFLLALLPWLELITLIQLGIATSALSAVAYVMLTFVLGLALIRRQGESIFAQVQQGGPVATRLLVDDMAMGLAGLLLLIPGLITDLCALLVLIGPLRRRIVRSFGGQDAKPQESARPFDAQERHGETLEGEYRRVDRPEGP